MQKEIKILSKHCRHLRWRGSECTPDEVVAIMKKHNGKEGSFWDVGEFLHAGLGGRNSVDASFVLDFTTNLKGYLNRIDANDSTQTIFPRMWDGDTIDRK
jgi:hypothetical protein